MLRLIVGFGMLLTLLGQGFAQAAEPLRVFIRSGPKTHGPGQHDHPRFLQEWSALLSERGAVVEGAQAFPTREQLERADVLVLHAQDAGNISVGEERKNLLAFLQRGGGVVVIHAGAVSRDPDWYKTVVGGSWRHGVTKWLEGPMSLYFTDQQHPITRDCGNFDLDDEIYYDMDLLPEVKVLGAAFTPKNVGARDAKRAEAVVKGGKEVGIYDMQPQLWTYEKDKHRAFVCLPGHRYENFSHNSLRALLLRGIAWAGKRADVDSLCKPEELGDALRYAQGGAPRPQDMAGHLEVHPDFDLSLVAAEPLINKPMNIDWDEKGRLWVVESPEYPNGLRQVEGEIWKDSGSVAPGNYQRTPLDRVSILTDSDGDGLMDHKKVFAGNIELATGMVLHRKGVIVSAAPDIWFFEDTDGDDVADKRTRLYTNLGINDTHAVINNLRWGLDGWVYATHGYSRSDNVTSGDGTRSFGPIGAGVVRFKPDGSAFEQYASRGGNTWGLDMTWDGQVFYTQPTSGNHLIHVVLPESVLAKGKVPGVMGTHGLLPHEPVHPALTWKQQAYVQIDQVGSYTAAAGCAIYEGGAWPTGWNHGYFTTEPTVNIVSHFMVEPAGTTYRAFREPGREQTEFIRSRNLWFRPIEVRTGPDGALYVVDFCNQAVIHNDTRGPRHGPANAAVRPDRDHYFGRIWKVQHKQAAKLEVPVLERRDLAGLSKAANQHPNRAVRQTAWRLLQEDHATAPETRELALRIDRSLGSPVHRIYRELEHPDNAQRRAVILERFENSDVADDWLRSALIAAAADFPMETLLESFDRPQAGKLGPLVGQLAPIALRADPASAAVKLVRAAASAPASADPLKRLLLLQLAVQSSARPAVTPELAEVLKTLLANPATAAQALPLVTNWDSGGVLAGEVKVLAGLLSQRLQGAAAPVDERIDAAVALIGLGDEAALAAVVAVLSAPEAPLALQEGIITALGESAHAGRLVPAFAGLKAELKPRAFDQILKRPAACLDLLQAVQEENIRAQDIGPGNIARLRTHPNREVSSRANALLDKLVPGIKQKNEIIAKLTPEVLKPGDAAQGRLLFGAACAVCHKLGDVGVRDVGPPLNGMGAHGAAELLVHVVDPNREVDPSFWQWNIITHKGETLAGVVVSENAAGITLRHQGGEVEVKKEDIATKQNTRRSLMPEGFEALGGEALRDIFAFMSAGNEGGFRVLDLREVYTADARRGLFADENTTHDSVFPVKYGNITAQGIPFFLMDPVKSSRGANLVVLKGGGKNQVASTYPQRVEIAVNGEARRLHLLSGIAGWGWPAIKEELPAMKMTITHADGGTEEVIWRNGVAFADYNREIEVPGSRLLPGLVERGQLRLITAEVKKPGLIAKITLESFDNRLTPVVAAITADNRTGMDSVPEASPKPPAEVHIPAEPKEGGKGDGVLQPAVPVHWEKGKTRVLIVGGGSSHDFSEFFGKMDSDTLRKAGFSVHYTEDRDQAAAELAGADVALISVNRRFFDTAAWRKALFDFAESGKGVVMLHPGTWYGYPRWPELNARLVGGGARGHDKLGPFQVKVTAREHPVMKEVPDAFEVVDELYHVNAEGVPEGTVPIEILAETSPSQTYGRPHPVVWLAQHPKTRVVNIALGHDERVHALEVFQRILTNAVAFAARR